MPDVISVRAEYDGSAEGAKRAGKQAEQAVDSAADKAVAANKRMAAAAEAAAGKTAAAAKRSSMSLEEIGSKLTTHVTLPLTIAGGASVAAAMNFETSFAHIEGLVGVTGSALEDLRDKTLALSGAASGKGPQELADGLYFITSSGLQGAAAMDALEQSARASAAGLGTTAQVADAVTSAVAAYSKEGLTAAEATDIMTATVKEGKIEADQLASTLGTVIPIASTAGVSLAEVGGAAAILSRNGASAGESMTQVRSFIDAVIKPSKQAANELENVGLSTAQLKKSLADDGLLATMRLLRDRFGENTEGIAKWAGRIEAMNAVLAITNTKTAEADRIFQSVAESAGITDKAFDAVSKTARFKLDGALAEVQESAVEMGGVLLPVVGDIAGAVGGAAKKFGEMDDGTQGAVIALGLVAAAAGPTIKAIDGVSKAWEALNTMGAGGAAGLGLGALVAGGAVLWAEHMAAVKHSEEAQRAYTDALREMKHPAQVATDQLREMVERINDSKTAAGEAVPELEGMAAAAKKIFEGEGAAAAAEKLGTSYQRVAELTRDGTNAFEELAEKYREGYDVQKTLDGMTDSQRLLAEEILGAADAQAISRGEAIDLFKAIDQVADASDDSREAQAAMSKVAIQAGIEAGIVSGQWLDLTLAQNGGRDSLLAWIEAGKKLAEIDRQRQLVQDLGQAASVMGGMFGQAATPTGDAAAAIDDVTSSAEDATKALEDMRQSLLLAFDAEGAQREAAVRLAESHQKLFDKTKAADDATRTYGEGSTEAATADYERVRALDDTMGAVRDKAEADVNAAVKQAESTGVTISAKDQNYIYRDSLVATRDATGDPYLIAYIDQLIGRINAEEVAALNAAAALRDKNRALYETAGQEVNYTGRDSSGTAVVRRAGGGPLFSRQLALVGEEGPELFIPDYAGTVLDADATAAAIAAAGAGRPSMAGAFPTVTRDASGNILHIDPAQFPGNERSSYAGIGGFSGKPASGGQLNFRHEFPQPAYVPDISGLTNPMTDVGPMGRFGPYTLPSEATPRQPFSNNVVVNVRVDGWANADPAQIGKAAYQALLQEARRRGNAGLRNILVSL
jgi:TP901 family phage tail tape measure protein